MRPPMSVAPIRLATDCGPNGEGQTSARRAQGRRTGPHRKKAKPQLTSRRLDQKLGAKKKAAKGGLQVMKEKVKP
jgi:hypothetical protein